MGEDVVDDGGIGDVGDGAESASAQGTTRDIELEGPFQALCPGQAWCAGRDILILLRGR